MPKTMPHFMSVSLTQSSGKPAGVYGDNTGDFFSLHVGRRMPGSALPHYPQHYSTSITHGLHVGVLGEECCPNLV